MLIYASILLTLIVIALGTLIYYVFLIGLMLIQLAQLKQLKDIPVDTQSLRKVFVNGNPLKLHTEDEAATCPDDDELSSVPKEIRNFLNEKGD